MDAKELATEVLELLPDMDELDTDSFQVRECTLRYFRARHANITLHAFIQFMQQAILDGTEEPWLIHFVDASVPKIDLEFRKLPSMMDLKVSAIVLNFFNYNTENGIGIILPLLF